MKEGLLWFLINLLDVVKIVIFARLILDVPLRKGWKNIVTSLILLIGGSYATWIMYNCKNKWVLFVVLILMVSVSLFLLDIAIGKGCVIAILIYFIVGNLDSISNVLLVSIGKREYSFDNYFLTLISGIITLIFFTIIGSYIKKKTRGSHVHISIGYLIALSAISFINTYVLSFFVSYLNKNDLIEVEKNLIYGLYGISIGVYFQIGLFLFLSMSMGFYRERNELSVRFIEAQKRQYEYLNEKEEITKKFRHDMKNHIYVLQNLFISQNWDELGMYIEEMSAKNKIADNKAETGNEIVDAIVNKYLEDAKGMGADVDIVGHMPAICHVNSFELCLIYANILSNALEAVKLCDDKKIKLEIRYDKDYIYIFAQNAYAMEIKKTGNTLLTTKNNKEYHGFGLKNIEDSVRKYNGDLQIETGNNLFRIYIKIMNNSL